jgi:hypothetical protein
MQPSLTFAYRSLLTAIVILPLFKFVELCDLNVPSKERFSIAFFNSWIPTNDWAMLNFGKMEITNRSIVFEEKAKPAIDFLGYGLIRRFDDTYFWIVISLLLTTAAIFSVSLDFDQNRTGLSIPNLICAGYPVGLLFVSFYILGIWAEPGGIANWKQLDGARSKTVQTIETVATAWFLFFAGCGLKQYSNALSALANGWTPSSDTPRDINKSPGLGKKEIQFLFSIGFFPLIAITLFSAATSLLPDRSNDDRVTWTVAQFVLFIVPYLIVWAVGLAKLRGNVDVRPNIVPLVCEVHPIDGTQYQI